MSRRFAFVFTLLLPAIQACDPADPCELAATVEPAFRLGLGEDDFRPLRDGDELPLSWGNQGGRHVWMAWQTDGIAPGNQGLGGYEEGPTVLLSLFTADGYQVGDGSTTRAMKGSAETAELVGQELFITWWGDTIETDGPPHDFSELTLRAELYDTRCGAELVEERTVTADL